MINKQDQTFLKNKEKKSTLRVANFCDFGF